MMGFVGTGQLLPFSGKANPAKGLNAIHGIIRGWCALELRARWPYCC